MQTHWNNSSRIVMSPHSDTLSSFQVTHIDVSFLLYDSDIDTPDRILMYSTETNCRALTTTGHWLADGTFKVAPELCYHVFTTHALVTTYHSVFTVKSKQMIVGTSILKTNSSILTSRWYLLLPLFQKTQLKKPLKVWQTTLVQIPSLFVNTSKTHSLAILSLAFIFGIFMTILYKSIIAPITT